MDDSTVKPDVSKPYSLDRPAKRIDVRWVAVALAVVFMLGLTWFASQYLGQLNEIVATQAQCNFTTICQTVCPYSNIGPVILH